MASYIFDCERCGRDMKVAAEYIRHGARARCPWCQTEFSVPKEVVEAVEQEQAEKKARKEDKERKQAERAARRAAEVEERGLLRGAKIQFEFAEERKRQEGTLIACPACGDEVSTIGVACPHCGHPMGTEQRAVPIAQLLGVVGSIVLFVGVFMPILSAPIVGNLNYFQNGKGDGTIVMGLALISLVFVLTKTYTALWLTGLGSLGLLAYSVIRLLAKLSQLKDQAQAEMAGNPFQGLTDAMMQSIQLQWGWAVLVVGAGLVLAAGVVGERSETRRSDRTGDSMLT